MLSRANFQLVLIAFAAGLAILGARWSLIERVGSPVPFQDQWYAEGEDLYLAAARGGVPASHFLQAHNDHRIVPTRLLAYALFRWNDQWDVRVQMMANALLAAMVCLPLLALCRPWLPNPAIVLVAALLAWFYGLPLLYENTLWGFQSPFYFLVLFSLLHLFLLLGRRAWSLPWWCGMVAGVAAIASMGSGLLAPVAVLLTIAWRMLREPNSRRELWPSLVAVLLLAVIGAFWLPPRLATSGGFQLPLFLRTIEHALSFPLRGASAVAALTWVPFGALLVAQAFRRQTSPAERILFAAGAWVLLQVVAISYARPEPGPILANRYGDILTVGLVVNLAVGAWLWRQTRLDPQARLQRGLLLGFFAAWFAFAGRQAVLDARIFRRELEPMMIALRSEHVARIRDFYRHNDPAAIADAAYPHIPVVDAPSLVRDLGFPELADAMPFELRNPIPLGFPEVAGQAALNNSVPVSLPNEPGALHRGTFFSADGVAATIDTTSAPARKHPRRKLLFKVAGDFKAGETELRLRDAHGAITSVITDLKSDTLHAVVVSVPGDRFQVEVFDQSPTRWIAFLEPVEIGPLSAAALAALPCAPFLARGGWMLLGVLGIWFMLDAYRTRRGRMPRKA